MRPTKTNEGLRIKFIPLSQADALRVHKLVTALKPDWTQLPLMPMLGYATFEAARNSGFNFDFIRVVGEKEYCGSLYVGGNPEWQELNPYIGILPQYRRQGIARATMAALAANYPECRLTVLSHGITDQYAKFCESLGMVKQDPLYSVEAIHLTEVCPYEYPNGEW